MHKLHNNPVTPACKQRIASLDVMRGFSMFWLIGGAAFIQAIATHFPSDITTGLAEQMTHARWRGIKFYDLIFPLFIFTSGATIPLTVWRGEESGKSRRKLALTALKRAAILIFIGVIYNEWLNHDFSNPRFCSVLGQIGASYLIGFFIYLVNPSSKKLLAAFTGILLIIGMLQLLPPEASLSKNINPSNNINSWIDLTLTPGRLLEKNYDPEGLLNWISAASICLLGAWTSKQVNKPREGKKGQIDQSLLIPAVAGVILIATGLAMDGFYPIIKRIWTASYTTTAGGICILLFLSIHIVADRKKRTKPFFIFTVIGANSLIAYTSQQLFNYPQFTRSAGNHLAAIVNSKSSLPGVLLTMLSTLCLLYWLHKKRIYLKV